MGKVAFWTLVTVLTSLTVAVGVWGDDRHPGGTTPGGSYVAGGNTSADDGKGTNKPYAPTIQVVGNVSSNDLLVFVDGTGRKVRGSSASNFTFTASASDTVARATAAEALALASAATTNAGAAGAGYYAMSNGAWRLLTGTIGPQGLAGSNGAAGAQGPAGPNGANGINGTNGAAGPQGIQGVQGVQGEIGPQGIQGIQGPAGPAGTNGAAGATGATGATGPQGPAGANGSNGSNGSNGTNAYVAVTNVVTLAAGSAAWASNNVVGTTNNVTLGIPAGANGAAGAQGPAGEQGPAGLTGLEGPQGPAGPASSSFATNCYYSTNSGNAATVGGLAPAAFDPAGTAGVVQANLAIHTNRQDNPHGTTAAQVGALSTNGGTVTGSILTTVTATPQDDELPTAGWVRGLFMAGAEWYYTTNQATGYGAKSANFVELSRDLTAIASSNVIASPVPSDTYLAGGVITGTLQRLTSPITIDMWAQRIGGTAASIIPLYAEVYYIYAGTTNHLGDWSVGPWNLTDSVPQNHRFVVSLNEPTITGAVKVIAYIKTGTVSGPAAGMRIYSGNGYSSHLDIEGTSGATAEQVDGRLTTHTNQTLAAGAHHDGPALVAAVAANGTTGATHTAQIASNASPYQPWTQVMGTPTNLGTTVMSFTNGAMPFLSCTGAQTVAWIDGNANGWGAAGVNRQRLALWKGAWSVTIQSNAFVTHASTITLSATKTNHIVANITVAPGGGYTNVVLYPLVAQ